MSTRSIAGGVCIDILVQPRASRAKFGPTHGDRIKVFVSAPPVDGEANAAVVQLLKKTFGISKAQIEITQGHTSRRKTVCVGGVTEAQVQEAAQ